MRVLWAVLLALALGTGPVAGQIVETVADFSLGREWIVVPPGPQYPLGLVRSPVLVVDVDRLYVESLYGKRAMDRVNAARMALQQENVTIIAALDAEERSLADRRPTMLAEEFREAAQEFDARVMAIRAEQDAKGVGLKQLVFHERFGFNWASRPIMGELMRRAGAVVILERQFLLESSDLERVVAMEQDAFNRLPGPVSDELKRRAGAVVDFDGTFVLDQLDVIDVTDAAIVEIDARIGDGSALQLPSDEDAVPPAGNETFGQGGLEVLDPAGETAAGDVAAP
jgi:hypothetical protein